MTIVANAAVIQFTRGVPPPEVIPADDLAVQAAAVLAERPVEVFQYAPIGGNQGDPELRRELADRHGVEPDDVFVGNGSLQVLDLLARHLLPDSSGAVCVEAPTYDRALAVFARHGALVVGAPVERDGLILDHLEAELKRRRPAFVYVIPDFQNPAGVTLSEEKRRQLVELAATYRFVIVEDSPYRELRYHGADLPSLRDIAGEARVITIGSLSKVLSPGLRVGYAISDRTTSQHLAALAESTYLSAVPLCQAVAAACLATGLLRSSIARTRDFLRPRCDAAVAVASSLLGDQLVAVPDGGYYLAAHLRVGAHEPDLLAAARARGLQLASGSAFYPPSASPPADTHFVRLPFQSLEPDDFATGLERLCQTVEALRA